MRFFDIKENGGRVVKGVNTTPDVGVDAIKKQAAKFGNKVDKDGRPPTLSKKVKGSKTNVLFNLGMAESVEERSLSKGEEKKKEKYVKGMKKSKGDFKDRYGKDAEAVMYATATKMAKEGQVHELQADELSEASEIYIDMDGVLVDFFGEWTKMQGVKDWKQIKNVGKALQDIRDTEDFWLKLKPTPNADKLLGLVKEIRGEYNILSAPLADDPRAEPHKREWIKKNLTAFPPKKVIITTDKAKYATSTGGTPNILIDDFGQNVAKWETIPLSELDYEIKVEKSCQSFEGTLKKGKEELPHIIPFKIINKTLTNFIKGYKINDKDNNLDLINKIDTVVVWPNYEQSNWYVLMGSNSRFINWIEIQPDNLDAIINIGKKL